MGSRQITRRRLIHRASGIAAAAAAGPWVARATEAAELVEQEDIDIHVVRDPQLGVQMAIADYYGYFNDEGLTITIHWAQSQPSSSPPIPGSAS